MCGRGLIREIRTQLIFKLRDFIKSSFVIVVCRSFECVSIMTSSIAHNDSFALRRLCGFNVGIPNGNRNAVGKLPSRCSKFWNKINVSAILLKGSSRNTSNIFWALAVKNIQPHTYTFKSVLVHLLWSKKREALGRYQAQDHISVLRCTTFYISAVFCGCSEIFAQLLKCFRLSHWKKSDWHKEQVCTPMTRLLFCIHSASRKNLNPSPLSLHVCGGSKRR